jgi:hypothetical protein
MKKISQSIWIALLCTQCLTGEAASLFFPDMSPHINRFDAPIWLKKGQEGDGYLSISSEVIAQNTCATLSEHGFWSSEKTQLVVSVTSSGFKSKLEKTEVPIATFDGRENASECASLSSNQVQIIPLTLLGANASTSANNLSIVLNVKSSNDSNHDFVGSAKLLLGAAAMVVSGGSAGAIGSVSSTVGSSVAAETQTKANSLLNGMVDAKVPLSIGWTDIRNGIKSVEIAVYRSNKNMGDSTDKKIQELQSNPKAEKTKLFTVRFNFNVTRSLFNPSITNIDYLVSREDLSPVRVLNTQAPGSNINFLQTLNNASPSLLIALEHASGRGLTSACALGFEKLSQLQVSNLDKAIIMKSMIDEAKGESNWYNNPLNIKGCFEQAPTVLEYLEAMFGVAQPQFVFGDVQNGAGPAYTKWRDTVGPLLTEFRRSLLAKENRRRVLVDFNLNKDIALSFSPEVKPWTVISESDATTDNEDDSRIKSQFPGLTLLADQKIKGIGCFAFKDSSNLASDNYGVYYVLKTENNESLLAFSTFNSDPSSKIKSLKISELTPDWVNYFKSLTFPGSECTNWLH